MEQAKDWAVGIAVFGTVALVGYSAYKCFRRKKSVSINALMGCMFEDTVTGLAKTGLDIGKAAWNKGVKPGAVEVYKKGLKPIGKTIFNKALKPGYKQLKSVPKKLEHESQKALKKTGNTLKKGVKKILRFGF